MPDCNGCKASLGRYDDSLMCSSCMRLFHLRCVGVSLADFDAVRKRGDWKCSLCLETASSALLPDTDRNTTSATLETVVLQLQLMEKNFSVQISELKSIIVGLQGDLKHQAAENVALLKELHCVRSTNEKLADHLSCSNIWISDAATRTGLSLSGDRPISYSGAAQKSFVAVKPKDAGQANSQTKIDLLKSINPITSDVDVVGVKHIANGGVIVSCSSGSDAEKFREMASAELSDKYEIKGVAKPHPRIRLVGLTEKHSSDSLVNFLKAQNADVFGGSEVTCIAVDSLRKNKKMYQAVVQIDPAAYQKSLNCGRLFVGYDSCAVYDAIEVVRCFNCSGYHHVASKCKNKTVCPKCAGEHALRECKSQNLKCVNCFNVRKIDPNIDFGHPAWDHGCGVYKKKVATLKGDILGHR